MLISGDDDDDKNLAIFGVSAHTKLTIKSLFIDREYESDWSNHKSWYVRYFDREELDGPIGMIEDPG